jgi:hypothetical protein
MSAANTVLVRDPHAVQQTSSTTPQAKYSVSIGYLRAFINTLPPTGRLP